MNRVEALEWAADYAERNKLFVPPQNARGYTVESWTHPSAAERSSIIRALATEIMDDEKEPVPLADLSKIDNEVSTLRNLLVQMKPLTITSPHLAMNLEASIGRIDTAIREIRNAQGNN